MLRILLILLAFPTLIFAAGSQEDDDPFNVDFFTWVLRYVFTHAYPLSHFVN